MCACVRGLRKIAPCFPAHIFNAYVFLSPVCDLFFLSVMLSFRLCAICRAVTGCQAQMQMIVCSLDMLRLLRIMKARQRSFKSFSFTSCVPVTILSHSCTIGLNFFDKQRRLGFDRYYKAQSRMGHSSRSSVLVDEMKKG